MENSNLQQLIDKFSHIEVQPNARTMEEVVEYIEEHWGAVRIKIKEHEYYAHLHYAAEFMRELGKDPESVEDEIRRYALPKKNICLILGMGSEYITSEAGIRYYQALTMVKGLTKEDIETKNMRWLQYMMLEEMKKDWDIKEVELKKELAIQQAEREAFFRSLEEGEAHE
ncbi:MAG: hypothetical protein R3Y53_00565 [Bacillota bacterium]